MEAPPHLGGWAERSCMTTSMPIIRACILRYKVAAWLRGLIPNCYMRPPMPRPTEEEIATLHALLAGAGLSVIEMKQAA